MFRNREIMLYTLIAAAFTLSATILCATVGEFAALFCFLGCVCVYAAFLLVTAVRYRKLKALCAYLCKLSTGSPAMDIRESEEGELSILKNEIYRVTRSLSEQTDALKQDKLELANALSDISHQLKTPLTSLSIMTELLENDALPTEKRREFLASIRAARQRMEWLVLSLLKLARLDADAVSLKKVETRLSDIVERAFAPLLIPMEIKAQSRSVEGEDETLVCDPEWTAESLGNILKNAIENTPEGGHITVRYGKNPIYTYITVRDNGPGPDRADLPHLFKRFYRGKHSGRDSAGIGLPLALTILQKQNGDMEAENDGGGVFTLKFYQVQPTTR